MGEAADTPKRIGLDESLNMLAQLRDVLDRPQNEHQHFARFCLDNIGRCRSQNFQDLWAIYTLQVKSSGYFVEFGALDGVAYSNSLVFERNLGWTGIVAEPNRLWHEAIAQNRKCAVDTRCVWTKSGEMLRFNQTPITGLSTIDAYSASDHNAPHRIAGERYEVESVSLDDLLDHWGAPRRIDYLSVDTEGSEYDILNAFDWRRHDIALITVEMCSPATSLPLHHLLTEQGYVRKFEAFSRDDGWYMRPDLV